MATYDWSGLRTRRIAIIAATLLILPGSCVATAADRGAATWLTGVVALIATLIWIRAWPCPRCNNQFAGPTRLPFVRPFSAACVHCGLPDFTPTAEEAPSIPIAVELSTARSSRLVSLLKSPRARVALVLAIPLVWVSTCRLPDGERVHLVTGQDLEVLGIVRNTLWTSSRGQQRRLILTYYSPRSPVAADVLLELARPAIQASGDSTVVLQELEDTWWARNFGIRISYQQVYLLGADGSWKSP